MKRILIVGFGFIGKSLANYLKDEFIIIAASKNHDSMDHEKIHKIKFDVLQDSFDSICPSIPDEIIYSLSLSIAGATLTNEQYISEIQALDNTLDYAIKVGLKRFILISSASIYGNTLSTGAFEKDPPFPINTYGKLKLQMETHLINKAKMHELSFIILRVSNLFGSNQMKQGIIKKIVTAATSNSEIQINNNGLSIRDYIYIDDFLESIRLILKCDLSNEVYNISSGVGINTKDVVSSILTLLDINEIKIKYLDNIDELLLSVLNNGKFKEYFPNWQPSNFHVSLKKLLKELELT